MSKLKRREVLLIENTRYEDLEGKKESSCDEELSTYWANLGDIYVNDAYGTSHRCHASNVGISKKIPNAIGFLIEKEITKLKGKELIKYRREDIGFVFQFYNLIANLTTLENIELACQLSKDALEPRIILGLVGLDHRMKNFPSQLSGGEQQRVAIARAIAKNPKLLLCDEPTGALDSETGKMIIDLLIKNCKNMGMTTVVITHNSSIAEVADKVITIKNGIVEDIKINKRPKKVDEIEW